MTLGSRTVFWVAATVIVVLDQLTKHLVERYLSLNGDVVPLAFGVVLRHIHNPGVAFGQLSNAGPLLILAAAAAAVGIVVYRVRTPAGETIPGALNLGLALPLGGAIGNTIDRLRIGKVVDFFDLGWFPVFNLADSAITVGACLLAVYFLFLHRPHARPLPVATESTHPCEAIE